MGERLVVNIIENSELKCAVYYHWSGYTSSTIAQLLELLHIIYDPDKTFYTAPNKMLKPDDKDNYKSLCRLYGKTDDDFMDPKDYQPEKTSDWLLRVIRCTENNGGGLQEFESNYAAAKERWPEEVFSDKNHVFGNYGIIALSDESMKDLNSYGEHFAGIHLDKKLIGFDMTLFNESDAMYFLAGDEEEKRNLLMNAPVAPYDFENSLNYAEFIDFLENHAEKLLEYPVWKRPNHPGEYFFQCM